MDVYNGTYRPVVCKKIVCKPSSYTGFSDVTEISRKRFKSDNDFASPSSDLSVTTSARKPTRKIIKITTDEDNKQANEESSHSKTHFYIAEQKRKWRQKTKNEDVLKKNLYDKRKQNLLELQIKSKVLLQKNLKKKALQSKIGSKKNTKTDISNFIIELPKSVSSLKPNHESSDNFQDGMKIAIDDPHSTEKGIEDNDSTIHNLSLNSERGENEQSVIKPVHSKDEQNINVDLSLDEKDEPISDISSPYKKNEQILNIAGCNKPKEIECAIIKIQKAYRNYQTRKKQRNDIHKNKNISNSFVKTDNKKDLLNSQSKINSDVVPVNLSFDFPFNFISAVKKKLSRSATITPKKRSIDKHALKKIFKELNSPDTLKNPYLDKWKISNPNNLSFLYNKTMDSIPVSPVMQTFLNAAVSKPKSYSERSSVIKQFDTKSNNTSCEVSVYKKSSNVSSASEFSESRAHAQTAVQKSTVISELKSSLEEIQNLTVSITFNGLIDKKSISNNTMTNETNNDSAVTNVDVRLSSQENESINLDTKYTDPEAEVNDTKKELEPPNVNLIWQRKNDAILKSDSKMIPGRVQSNKMSSAGILQKSFQSELSLLESFNESLRQVQMVEETLTSMRQHTSNDSEVKNSTSERNVNNNLRYENNNSFSEIDENSKTPSIVNLSPRPDDSKHSTKRKLFDSKESNKSLSQVSDEEMLYKQKMMETRGKTRLNLDNVNKKSVTNESFRHYDFFTRRNPSESQRKNNSMIFSQTELLNRKSSIANIFEHVSVQHSLPNDNIDRSSIVSLNDVSNNICHSKKELFKSSSLNLANHLNNFCVCLLSQYIEDEKVRSEYLNTLLKVREKTLLDATRSELLCLEFQKKQNQDQIPFLKKKQRGLLLKLQQERNEIKHIKKFQLEQSQERKATLKRQLKHLKRMLACEESFLDVKKKSNSLKSSSMILQSNRSTQSSPLKGIDISFGSVTNTSNSSFVKLKEGLEKKRANLNEQKKKMNELLQLHYYLQLDVAEIKAMEQKLKKPSPMPVEKAEKEVSQDKINLDLDVNILSVSNQTCDEKNPESIVDKEDSINDFTEPNVNENVSTTECKGNRCNVVSGYTLNKLWEKITGQNCSTYEENINYYMTRETLETFFNEAKQIALQGLLKSLKFDANMVLPTKLKQEEFQKLKQEESESMPPKSLNTITVSNNSLSISKSPKLSQGIQEPFNTIQCSEVLNKSQPAEHISQPMLTSPNQSGNVSNDIDKTNNSIDINLTYEKLSPSNILSETFTIDEPLSSSQEQSHSEDISQERLEDNMSKTFVIGEDTSERKQLDNEEDNSQENGLVQDNNLLNNDNLSTESCDQSNTSKSTAHSLVEELLDITKADEQIEDDNVELNNSKSQEPSDNSELKMNLPKENDEIVNVDLVIDKSPSVIVYSSKFKDESVQLDVVTSFIDKSKEDKIISEKTQSIMNKIGGKKLTKENNVKVIDSQDSNLFSKPFKDSKKLHVGTKTSVESIDLAIKSNLQENVDSLSKDKKIPSSAIVKTDFMNNKKKPFIDKHTLDKNVNTFYQQVVSKKENDILYSATFELDSQDPEIKRFYSEDKNDLHKIGFLEDKTPVYSDLLMGSWETVSPSPEPSPRDSPTGEYSPAAAVSLPSCRIDEAEELRKKQLAIELEIKALEQQQSQIPYCLVREIPDKPPPPYIPPSEEIKSSVVSSPKNVPQKTTTRVVSAIQSYCSWLWSKFSVENSGPITYNDYNKSGGSSFMESQNNLFLFDLCCETFANEFKAQKPKITQLWEYNKKSRNKTFEKTDICLRVEGRVKEILGLDNWPVKENLIITWSHKRQDHVNDLLIKELYKEEADWSNTEQFEYEVKNDLTNSILNSLILEAVQECKKLFA